MALLSHSRIRKFEKCARAYEVNYIDQVEEQFDTIAVHMAGSI